MTLVSGDIMEFGTEDLPDDFRVSYAELVIPTGKTTSGKFFGNKNNVYNPIISTKICAFRFTTNEKELNCIFKYILMLSNSRADMISH